MSTAASIYFSNTHYDIKYVYIQNIRTTTAVLTRFPPPSYACTRIKKKLSSTSNLEDSCVRLFPNTFRSKSTLVQRTELRELHTHRTIVDGEKKSPTAITPRCPDNRRELRVHATTVVVVVVAVITYSRVQINRKVANPVHMIS